MQNVFVCFHKQMPECVLVHDLFTLTLKKITFFWKVLLLQQCAVQQAHGRNVRGVHGPDTAASGASDHISSKGKGRNLQAAHNQLEIPCCIECFMPTANTTFFCVQRAAGEVEFQSQCTAPHTSFLSNGYVGLGLWQWGVMTLAFGFTALHGPSSLKRSHSQKAPLAFLCNCSCIVSRLQSRMFAVPMAQIK